MTPAEFKTRFPAFASTSDAAIELAIADAAPFFNVARWGGFYARGLANFVAHELVLSAVQAAQGAGSGAISASATTSKSVGDVTVSYSSAIVDASARDPFQRTTYGQAYAALRRMVGIGAFTT